MPQLRKRQLADGSVDGAKVEDNSLTGDDIEDGTILSADLASVAEAKITYADKIRNIPISCGDMQPVPDIPPLIATWGSGYLDFSAWELLTGVRKAVDVFFAIPEDYKNQTDLNVELFYAAKADAPGPGDQAWRHRLRVSSLVVDSVAGYGTDHYNTYTVTTTDQDVLKKITTNISYEDEEFSRGGLCAMRLFREGNAGADTFTSSIYLIAMNVKYTSDRRGT